MLLASYCLFVVVVPATEIPGVYSFPSMLATTALVKY